LSSRRHESLIRAETLSCGLELVTEPMADVRSVAVGFWVGSGSRDEPEVVAGASHFFEHLLFKGTATRSAAAIAEALDEVGGDCNAYTTKEYTAFYIRLLAEHLPLGLDILSEIMWNPRLDADDLEAERTVILEEILMHADEPADLVVEQWVAAEFPGHPLGRDTLGSAESVRAITVDDVGRFFDEHYRPKNMVVSVAGDIVHEEVRDALESRLTGRTGGSQPRRVVPTAAPEPLVVRTRATEQAHLTLGTRCVSRFDEDRWAFSVLNQVLGGGMSSRLFQKIREQRGLVYSIASDRAAYEDTGTLSVMAGTAPDFVHQVLALVVDELAVLASDGVSDRELAVAKGNLRAETLLAGEDSGARMSRIGAGLLLHHEVKTVDELLGNIERVERADVQRVAQRLAASPRTLSVVGPFGQDAFDRDTLGLASPAASTTPG
jgi:predicted Zn-dependent peptidase